MAHVRNYTWAAGAVMVEGQELGKVTSATLDISTDEITAKAGDTLDDWANEIVGRAITGTIDFQMYAKEAVSQLVGGTESTTAGNHWINEEVVTIDAAGGNTLTNGGSNSVLQKSVVMRFNNEKVTYKKVSATPADGEFTVDATGALTWNVSDTYDGTAGVVSYAYVTTDTTADKLTLASTDTPAYVELVLVAAGRNESSEAKSYTVIRFPKVRFGNLTTGFTSDDFSTWSASFTAIADTDGTTAVISTELA